jgi:type IV pilus assembly protein PilA
MRYLDRIGAIASGIAPILLLAACGGGTPDPTPAAIAEATKALDSAKIPVARAYESSRTADPLTDAIPAVHYNFPLTSKPPISTTINRDAIYVTAVFYNSSFGQAASVVLTLGGTGNTNLDGKFLGMFATGQTDGTVVWHCGTATAATATAPGAVTAMYPYLPEYCQN